MHIVVIGAGLSGLTAAHRLHRNGHRVTVLDKGRSVGGRLATRRLALPDGRVARVDHGAQFFTVRDETMGLLVRAWIGQGLVREWCRGFGRGSADAGTGLDADAGGTVGDGYPRYVVTGGMTALAKHLAADLHVQCERLVFAIAPAESGWAVTIDDGTVVHADALVVTSPLPQTLALLVTADVTVPDHLLRTDYDRTIALLVALDGPGAVPAPGGLQAVDGVISWIGDNAAKGISEVPALTVHATPEWSEHHWNEDGTTLERLLLDHARPWFGGATPLVAQVKKWRFATPRHIWPDPCWVAGPGRDVPAVAPLVLAGDAFAGPRVEGAVLSGLAAADALLL